MKTRFVMYPLLFAVALGALALTTTDVQAQATGRIYLTSEQVPTDLKGKALRKFLKNKRVSVLKKSDGGDSWTAHGFAKLSTRPSAKLMKLDANDGKIQIVARKRVKRRWVLVKIGTLSYSERTRLVRFEISISDDTGVPKGKKTKLQLIIRTKRNKVKQLASTFFTIK